MDITISADDELIRKLQSYAEARHTTVDDVIRDCLVRVVGDEARAKAAADFRRIATCQPGRSDPNWRFDRRAIHRHEEDRG